MRPSLSGSELSETIKLFNCHDAALSGSCQAETPRSDDSKPNGKNYLSLYNRPFDLLLTVLVSQH